MGNVNNYEVYNSRMAKSAQDKLFWLSLIQDKIDSVIDFGCADGSIMSCIHEVNPKLKLFGYDNNPDMIEIASTFHGFEFYDDWNACLSKVNPSSTVLNLSSVIHEVYSYAESDNDIDEFWARVFNSRFKYIAIRDLCVSKDTLKPTDLEDAHKVANNADMKQLIQFEYIWGLISNYKTLVHFLLKYKYTENWDREVKENYLPIYTEELMAKIPIERYSVEYFEEYKLPYTVNQIKEDFDVDLKCNTHVKLLLKLKDD